MLGLMAAILDNASFVRHLVFWLYFVIVSMFEGLELVWVVLFKLYCMLLLLFG